MSFSLGAEREASKHLPSEQIIVTPGERRPAVLRIIGSARRTLILSLFRCDDALVLDALANALQRGVRVEVLLTRRAKGWKKRLRNVGSQLESMGARVHVYADPVVKYHAKYVVADDGPALITSLNLTQKCFETTCDFIQLTHDPEVVSSLVRLFEADCRTPETVTPTDLSDRLIVAPERARNRIAALLEQARWTIRIVDPKVTDPEIVGLLKVKSSAGVAVDVLEGGMVGNLLSHGKLILLDDHTAVVGSMSLSALSLGFRRELAIIVREPSCIRELSDFFRMTVAARAGRADVTSREDADDDDGNNDQL